MALHSRKLTRNWSLSGLAAAVVVLLCSPNARSESLVDSALRSFLGNDSNTAGFDLDKRRPQAVSEAAKREVVARLPPEGTIHTLKEPLQRKLDSMDAVLQLHQRQSVYVIRVFESEPKAYAFIGLNSRCALLISDAALMLLDAQELQASVAHEVGHEYVWAEYNRALKRNDDRRLKELELFSDGVAILTLRRVGLDPAPLLRAAEKITKFNRLSTGPGANAHRYPSMDERRKFAEAVIQWVEQGENR